MFVQRVRGMTLVELLVAISIMSLTMLGMTAFFVDIWRSQGYQIRLGQAAQYASRGVSAVTETIRQAQQADDGSYLLKSGTDFDIVFFANIDNDAAVERVHYYMSGNTFLVGISDPAGTAPYNYPASDTTTETVSSNVVNTAADPIFQYYDNNANLLTTPVSPARVYMVGIRLLVDVDPFTSPIPVTVKSRTTMRNLVNY